VTVHGDLLHLHMRQRGPDRLTIPSGAGPAAQPRDVHFEAGGGKAVRRICDVRPCYLAVVVYRDRATTCPRCRSELAEEKLALVCVRCGGTWGEERVLVERWMSIAPLLPIPVLTPRVDRKRRLECVVCESPMAKVMFESIELDRCDEHGIWFDAGELDRVASTAMLEAGLTETPPPEPERPRRGAPIPLVPFIAQEKWPAERDDFEIMLNAELKLADLDARAGDDDEVRILLQRAILTMDEAIQRWPDVISLVDRRTRLVETLALYSRSSPSTPMPR
jgi:hypothetical protein